MTPRFVTIDTTKFAHGHDEVSGFEGVGPNASPPSDDLIVSTINGTETISDLAVGAATEITVGHEDEATFSFCEYPHVMAPDGVRVTVLATRPNGEQTNNQPFVLLVENIGYGNGYDYGGVVPDMELVWTRRGVNGAS